ncbi:MAG: trypsin-like peptidase domain-containing protein [Lachnospiraceae bacterium]|nr:trypsin-like peptidase domain-containing protein [Lachnospiraceae bacterium]
MYENDNAQNGQSYGSGNVGAVGNTGYLQTEQTGQYVEPERIRREQIPMQEERTATAGQGTQQSGTWNNTTAQQRFDGQQWKMAPEHTVEPEKKKGHTFRKLMLSLSMGLLFGIFAGVGFLGVTQASNVLQKNTPEAVTSESIIPHTEVQDEALPSTVVKQEDGQVINTTSPTNVTTIVKDVMPAMVSIVNNYTEVTSFWGQRYQEDLSASGSGIIVAKNDSELLIVTNQHVVADANELIVTLDDGTEAKAKIKGKDADMDLAVIAVDLGDLSAETLDAIAVAKLGDSDELELGEQVIAIGNALGYGQSVTVGYISALDREIELEDGSTKSFIQTDAAINPGNSGGALLNAAGEVIGINSNKIGGSSIEGMGYAIPITAASPIIADLMERQTRNKVADGETGYIGISYQDVTDDISKMFGMPKGVYVATVYEGTGAEAAGIMKGDVITKFDGERITSFADLQDVLQYFGAGDTVKVTVMRPSNGEYTEKEVQLTLGTRPNRSR